MSFFDQYNSQADVGQAVNPAAPNYAKTTAPKASGQTGLLSRVLGGLTQAPKYFLNADIVNPTKELAASATGNKQALANAQKAQTNTLGSTPMEAIKRLAGNSAQLATMVAAPEAKGVGLGAKVAQGAKIGAVAGGGSALANNQNVLTGAATGALTGGVANGVLSKVLPKVLPGKAVAATDTAATQDATKVAAAKTAAGLKSPVAAGGAQAQKYGTDLLANKLNVSPADATKFNGPETVAKLQKDYGLTTHQAAALHPVVTGGEGATTTAMDQALEGMGKVNFNDFGNQMHTHLADPEYQAANLPDGVASAQGKNLQAVINKYHEALNPQGSSPLLKSTAPGAQIDTGTNAKSAMDIAKNLEKEGYKNQASASPNKQALSDLQLKMADTVKSKIFNAPGGQAALEGAKADASGQLNDIAKASGNTKLASVANAIKAAPDFPSFRNVSQPFVNAKQLVDKSNLNDFANAGQNMSKGGLFSTVKSAASKVASPVGGKVLSNMGNKIADNTLATASGKTGTNFLANMTAKAGTAGAAAAAGNPPQTQQSSGSAADTTQNATDMVSSLGSGTTDASTPSDTNSPFSSDNIKSAILEDMQLNGGKNISSLISLYNTFGKPDATQSTAEKNTVDSLNSALATLGTYNDQLNSSGGGRGVAGGDVQNFLGKFGLGGSSASDVRAIESQKTDVATSIAKALTGGKPSSTQIKSWEDAIPNVTDSPAVAKQKMANITASINSKLQTLSPAQ